MALRGAAARRYAQAVFDIAKDTGTLDRWLSDLNVLSRVFGSDNAMSALEDPKLTEEDKRRVVTEHLPKAVVDPLASNFVMLLVQRERLSLLHRIAEIFQEMYNKEKGIVIADVTTAVPLDEAHKKHIVQQLSKITGKTVEVRLHEDPRILGGIVTRIGDELIDASIATRLATLGERLS